MNIFFLDYDPAKCAIYHVDKHVVKMIVEYAQLLSTAHRVLDGKAIEMPYTTIRYIYDDNEQLRIVSNNKTKIRKALSLHHIDPIKDSKLYAATHVNHPSAIWVRKSKSNYMWLLSLLKELINEYTYRYENIHKTSRIVPYLESAPINIPDDNFVEPTLAMPDKYRSDNALFSYRRFYRQEKVHLFSWAKREPPEFLELTV